MSIFHWLTGDRNHHIVIKKSASGRDRYWWEIVRRNDDGTYHDVANCPTPGFSGPELAREDARHFLKGIGANYLEVKDEVIV